MKTALLALSACLLLGISAQAEGDKTPPPGMENFKIEGDPVKGQAAYKIYCVACHGETGKGDGLAAAALNPKPRDFSDKARMDAIPDWEIFTVIKEGGTAVGLSPLMVGWAAALKDDQGIQDVAAFVRSLSK